MVLPAATAVVVGAVTVGAALSIAGPTGVSATSAPDRGAITVAAPATPGTQTPSAAEATAIAAAVRASSLTAAVPPESYQVTGTVLARSDTSWAWVELRPVVADVDRVEAVLHRAGNGWELVQLGSYEVGCGIVPGSVSADFALECPSDAPTYDT